MTEPPLGIDISKLKFNVCLININGKLKHKVFPNTSTGFEQLLDWLSKQSVERIHACMEATGTYGEALALFLHQAGQRVSVVNPAAIKAFAQSRFSRTKTDRCGCRVDCTLLPSSRATGLDPARAGSPRTTGPCAPLGVTH
jgi:transposase